MNKKGMKKGDLFRPEDLEKLRRIYPTTRNAEIAEIFGWTICRVKVAANRAGIKKCPIWQHQERVSVGKENQKSPEWNARQVTAARKLPKGRSLTASGFQDIEVMPWGRIIRHTLADDSRSVR